MILESPTNPTSQQQVDPSHMAARVSLRPIEHVFGGVPHGHYRLAARSGAVTGTDVDAASPLFAFRWTDPDTLLVLLLLEAFMLPTAAFTAAQEIGVDAVLASAYSAFETNGAAVAIGAGNRVRRSGMSTSRLADVRMATVTQLTAGTRALDANAFIAGGGQPNVENVAAGTEYLTSAGAGPVPFGFRYAPDLARGEHPIVIAANEGVVVRSLTDFPAAGAVVLTVNMAWAEVRSF